MRCSNKSTILLRQSSLIYAKLAEKLDYLYSDPNHTRGQQVRLSGPIFGFGFTP